MLLTRWVGGGLAMGGKTGIETAEDKGGSLLPLSESSLLLLGHGSFPSPPTVSFWQLRMPLPGVGSDGSCLLGLQLSPYLSFLPLPAPPPPFKSPGVECSFSFHRFLDSPLLVEYKYLRGPISFCLSLRDNILLCPMFLDSDLLVLHICK